MTVAGFLMLLQRLRSSLAVPSKWCWLLVSNLHWLRLLFAAAARALLEAVLGKGAAAAKAAAGQQRKKLPAAARNAVVAEAYNESEAHATAAGACQGIECSVHRVMQQAWLLAASCLGVLLLLLASTSCKVAGACSVPGCLRVCATSLLADLTAAGDGSRCTDPSPCCGA
jgi:hypothetical protein